MHLVAAPAHVSIKRIPIGTTEGLESLGGLATLALTCGQHDAPMGGGELGARARPVAQRLVRGRSHARIRPRPRKFKESVATSAARSQPNPKSSAPAAANRRNRLIGRLVTAGAVL